MSDWRRRIDKLETERATGAPGTLGALIRASMGNRLAEAIEAERAHGRAPSARLIAKAEKLAAKMRRAVEEMEFVTGATPPATTRVVSGSS